MGITKQMMIEEYDRQRLVCKTCSKPNDGQCDHCGEPVCSMHDGAYCWQCADALNEED